MAQTDKGTKIMDGLLLRQYHESPNLVAYLHAYVEEMDDLFYAIEDVYFGRFLETAVGAQLDVIGEILQQSRNIDMGQTYFGFAGATGAQSFGTTTDPLIGGNFKSLNQGSGTITPLDDEVYRRVLLCKGELLNRDTASLEDIYSSVMTLVGKVPKKMIVTEPGNLQVQLEMDITELTGPTELLIYYMAQYFIPAGMTFTIIKT